jgi:hypothetical protein
MRRSLITVLVLVGALCCAFRGPAAEVRIEASPGGDVLPFVALFASLRQSGERVIIDGPCLSACTLVLSIIPRSRICVTPRAILGFHAAALVDRYGDEAPATEVTRAVSATYPAPVRTWIARHGGLTRKLIFLYGRELSAIYPRCP